MYKRQVFDQGMFGGTTVSATMIAAKMAGIEVFVTGGVGGVHRDFHTSAFITISSRFSLSYQLLSFLSNAYLNLIQHNSWRRSTVG